MYLWHTENNETQRPQRELIRLPYIFKAPKKQMFTNGSLL